MYAYATSSQYERLTFDIKVVVVIQALYYLLIHYFNGIFVLHFVISRPSGKLTDGHHR